MSEYRLGVEPLYFGWVALIIALITIAFLVALELKKKQKLVAYRITALLLLSLAIVGLILHPTFLSKEQKRAVLLTPGYDQSKVDSLLKSSVELKIFRYGLAESFPNSQDVTSASKLKHENIRYVFGEGLPEDVLSLLTSGFVFLPARLPNGIIELNIPTIFSGRKNLVSGVFNARHKTKLKLIGPAGTEDSTLITPGKRSFAFSFTPKQPGLVTYQLVSVDSISKNHIEMLPVEVKPQSKLNILLLQDFPANEFRHLKNFLAEGNHSIIVRTRTSKNSFVEEFINAPKIELKILSPELLVGFDLVIADSKAMESLTVLEKSNLERAVQNGLGLIVLHDRPSKKNDFYSVSGKPTATDTTHLQVGSKTYVLPAFPLEIKGRSDLRPILRNSKRVLAGYQHLGAGKIGFQLLQETFRLRLEGSGFDYATVWSALIEEISRKRSTDFELELNRRYPYYADDVIPFSVISSGKIPEVFSDSVKIPLQENPIIDDYWQGKTWAGIPGWHRLRVGDSTVLNYFVHEKSAWQSLRATYLMRGTLIASQENSAKNAQLPMERRPVPQILFYLVFLIAAGFLWLTPKI